MFNLTAIASKLPKTAFELFRYWTKQQRLDIIIKNEQILVEDLRNAVISALRSLWKKDVSEKMPGWSIGFFWGFVSSNLRGCLKIFIKAWFSGLEFSFLVYSFYRPIFEYWLTES